MLWSTVEAGSSAHGPPLDSVLLRCVPCTARVLVLIVTVGLQQVKVLYILLNCVSMIIPEIRDSRRQIQSGILVESADRALLPEVF